MEHNVLIVIIFLTIIITFIWAIDSYCTYKRLDRQADALITDTEMSENDKRDSLFWHARNVTRQRIVCFPIFSGKLTRIANKLYNAAMDI